MKCTFDKDVYNFFEINSQKYVTCLLIVVSFEKQLSEYRDKFNNSRQMFTANKENERCVMNFHIETSCRGIIV